MAIPSPDTLHDIVRPVHTPSADIIAALTAKMSDPKVVTNAYRGAGIFNFYVPGYKNGTSEIEVTKALTDAGYDVHSFSQRIGYMPPDYMVDYTNADYDTPDVTGNSQYLWLFISVAKKYTK